MPNYNEFEILFDPDASHRLGTNHLYAIRVPDSVDVNLTRTDAGETFVVFSGRKQVVGYFIAVLSTLFHSLCSRHGPRFDPNRGLYVATLENENEDELP